MNPRRHVVSGPPTPTLRRVDRAGIADEAARDYRADYKRCARIAKDMAEVGAHGLASEFRVFAYIALRASRAERR